ncbi:MAG: alpha-L-fucosidase [Lachnospira sp.]|nr:alpha-L-fucosidase [Lachnospira sp.]
MSYDMSEWEQKVRKGIAGGPYTDTWESLSQHETPKWFRDAKFGIFIHWGLYSVPAFGSEWYSRYMYLEGRPEFDYHRRTYGLQKDFGYKDFIPMFTAGRFDPDAWAKLFRQAGAKFVVPVAEHHDGFQMYASELSSWNALKMGPHRDILAELTESLHREGLVSGASSHRIEHWWFMSPGAKPLADGTPADRWSDIPAGAGKRGDFYWPSVPRDVQDNDDRCSTPVPSDEFLSDWMYRTIEIIDRFQPQELYFDWWVYQEAAKPYLRKILAYYYNRGVTWGKEVMVITKYDGIPFGCAVPDMERGGFDSPQPDAWQTDTAIGKESWGYTRDNVYKPARVIILDLVDAISRNGTMLLNVGPKPDGTITKEDTDVLLAIGEWLSRNGEAVYGSRPWRICGEGPTALKAGAFADRQDTAYTAKDFRFTVNHGHLYIFAMKYPEAEPHGGAGCYSESIVHSLAGKAHPEAYEFGAMIRSVTALGSDEKPQWFQTEEGLVIRTKTITDDKPVVFRVDFV